MFALSILSARGRLSTFAGALVALIASSALVVAGGMPLEAALRTHPPVERYAGAAAVVAGDQVVGKENDVPLSERARISSALVAKARAVPGVRAAIADTGAPAWLAGRPTVAHGWSSAALTPYALRAGRAPAAAGEVVVTSDRRALGAHTRLVTNDATRSVTVVGVAAPRHAVTGETPVFTTDAEAARLAGHAGQADAIGVLAGPGFDAARLRAALPGTTVLTGNRRGEAERPDVVAGRTELIAVAASFGGMALFIAIFVVAGTMGLSIQQREREIALLRAVAATPGQIRRMIAWEAALVGLIGSAIGVWPGVLIGRAIGHGLVRHGIAPSYLAVRVDWLPIAGAVAAGIAAALLAVLAAGKRASRIEPTRALTDASVEPRLLGKGRLIGGLVALAAAAPLLAVSATTHSFATAAPTSQMTALFLVAAVGCLGPIVARGAGVVLAPLARVSRVGGFLAAANLTTSARRFSSASTPLVLTVALSATLLFSNTTQDHAVTQQRAAGLSADLAVSSDGTGIPASTLAAARATRGVQSAVALTPTTLGPSLGASDDTIPAAVLDGGQAGGFDPGVTAGSLGALHGDAIALGRERAASAHAHVGDRVAVTLGDGTQTHATVAAIYTRELGFGEALLAPGLAAGHTTSPLLGTVLVKASDPAAVARELRSATARYPGLAVTNEPRVAATADAERETNRWLAPLFVALIFGFSSIAVVNTLMMIALRRGRELALLRLVGATPRQVRSMARWEAVLTVAIGLGVGLAIAATALLPLTHALTGTLRPYMPTGQLVAIVAGSALLAFVALALPTRRALRARPAVAIGVRE